MWAEGKERVNREILGWMPPSLAASALALLALALRLSLSRAADAAYA